MYTVEFWDKISPINRVSAEKYFEMNPEMSEVNIILVKSGNRVSRIEDPDILKEVYGWVDKSDEEVVELLLQKVNEPADE